MDENEEFEFRLRAEQESAGQQQQTIKPVKIGKEAFEDTLRQQLASKDWATRNIIGAGSALTSAWEGLKGLAGQSDPSQVAATKVIGQEAPVGRIVGEVAMLAPTLAIPGAATASGAAVIGGISGAALTPGGLEDRAMAAGLGAAGGAIGAGLSRGASARPSFEPSDAVKTMQREGVSLTPGQNIGGLVRRFEDRLTSTPFVGDIIEKSRIRGVEDFNRAVLGRAKLPTSQVDEIGSAGLSGVRQELSDAYEATLRNAAVDVTEPSFVSKLASLRQGVKSLPKQEASEFDNIIAREIDSRLAPNGVLSGENLKDASAGLRNESELFAKSPDAYQRKLSQALKQAGKELQDLVKTANPKVADDLKMIDTAYANFKRAQRAATSTGSERGVFTPQQLHGAIKAMDKSKDKRAFSEGTALMQDLSAAGKEVLPSTIPDSGTAGRLMGSLSNPWALAGLPISTVAAIPATILYSKSGQAAINFLVNKGIRPTAESIRMALAQNPGLISAAGAAGGRLSELSGQ